MPKTSDLVFDNVDEFLKNNPTFAIRKLVLNTAAIRAVLREGTVIEGVRLVEGKPDEGYLPNVAKVSDQGVTTLEEILTGKKHVKKHDAA